MSIDHAEIRDRFHLELGRLVDAYSLLDFNVGIALGWLGPHNGEDVSDWLVAHVPLSRRLKELNMLPMTWNFTPGNLDEPTAVRLSELAEQRAAIEMLVGGLGILSLRNGSLLSSSGTGSKALIVPAGDIGAIRVCSGPSPLAAAQRCRA